MGKRPTDKRSRLIQTAVKLVHQKGFNRTTLGDIAQESEVPLGNLYYYFKTKEAIGEALIEQRLNEFQAKRQEWDRITDPRARLEAFILMTVDNRRLLSRSGCPIGSLCAELHKEGGALADQATQLFAEILTWLEVQFRELGHGKQSRGHAVHLLSVLQGASLLTHSFHTSSYLQLETDRLQNWLRTL